MLLYKHQFDHDAISINDVAMLCYAMLCYAMLCQVTLLPAAHESAENVHTQCVRHCVSTEWNSIWEAFLTHG